MEGEKYPICSGLEKAWDCRGLKKGPGVPGASVLRPAQGPKSLWSPRCWGADEGKLRVYLGSSSSQTPGAAPLGPQLFRSGLSGARLDSEPPWAAVPVRPYGTVLPAAGRHRSPASALLRHTATGTSSSSASHALRSLEMLLSERRLKRLQLFSLER